jgi:hypothetical protein
VYVINSLLISVYIQSSYMHKLLVLIAIFSGFIFNVDSKNLPEISPNQGVKFVGLTKTLSNLLKTRTPRSFGIGAYEISMESLIDKEIASLFDCDSVIDNFLSETGDEATYEMLSDKLKNAILDRFDGEDGSLFVNIISDTTVEGLHFNFAIYRDRPVILPIVLNASDSCFSTSFDTTCTVKFEVDIDLFINISLANSGSGSQAARIRINKFVFELTSNPDPEDQLHDYDCEDYEKHDHSKYVQKPQRPISFNIEGDNYSAAARCFDVFACSYWYLTPEDATDFVENEEQCYTLSFDQLEKGEFKWDNIYLSSFLVDLIMIPEVEKWDSIAFENNSSGFHYSVDNLFDDSGLEQISLCCNYWVKDSVTARNKKFILK